MRIPFTAVLAACFAGSAAAFAPSAKLSRSSTKPSFQLDAVGPGHVFPGVSAPEGKIPEALYLPRVDQKIGKYFGPAFQILPGLIGTPKTEGFEDLQKAYLASQNLASQISDPEYKFFGNDDHEKNLLYLLKTNPFMATALTVKGRGYEIVAFDPKDKDCKNPIASEPLTRYRKIMNCLDGVGHRINIRFNAKMTCITKVRVYDDISGELIHDIDEVEDTDGWAAAATYDLIYYASCVHATIHVLHYLCTIALKKSSEDFDELEQWANTYAAMTPNKYEAVGELLVCDQPDILSVLGPNEANSAETIENTFSILTGSSGMGAQGDKLRPILKDMLDTWATNPTTWIQEMMNIPAERMEESGILTEFMKHHDLVAPYASEVTSALREIDSDKYTIAELQTKAYLKKCGIKSSIDTLDQWVQIMSVTGLVHGCTLSYSRAFSTPEILKWRDIQSDIWETADLAIVTKGLATISGMQEGRHVFNPTVEQHALVEETGQPFDNGTEYNEKLKAVLEKYDSMSTELKEAYKIKIMENHRKFINFGWLLSDFCPDGFDGKQLTIATYI